MGLTHLETPYLKYNQILEKTIFLYIFKNYHFFQFDFSSFSTETHWISPDKKVPLFVFFNFIILNFSVYGDINDTKGESLNFLRYYESLSTCFFLSPHRIFLQKQQEQQNKQQHQQQGYIFSKGLKTYYIGTL
jgi:hypothetical protein